MMVPPRTMNERSSSSPSRRTVEGKMPPGTMTQTPGVARPSTARNPSASTSATVAFKPRYASATFKWTGSPFAKRSDMPRPRTYRGSSYTKNVRSDGVRGTASTVTASPKGTCDNAMVVDWPSTTVIDEADGDGNTAPAPITMHAATMIAASRMFRPSPLSHRSQEDEQEDERAGDPPDQAGIELGERRQRTWLVRVPVRCAGERDRIA